VKRPFDHGLPIQLFNLETLSMLAAFLIENLKKNQIRLTKKQRGKNNDLLLFLF
jgi:hypothetical protein